MRRRVTPLAVLVSGGVLGAGEAIRMTPLTREGRVFVSFAKFTFIP
ncbi:MAG: hypothetical protein HY654_08445 [Acidobacteria bacterium]|nr:hypothetical protein [Acidobacteriota bacterium]